MTFPRFIGCIVVTYLALILGSTFWNILITPYVPMPQLPLILLIYYTLRGPSSIISKFPYSKKEVGPVMLVALGCILGYLCDLLQFTPMGLQALLLSLCTLSLFALSTKLLVRGKGFLVAITGITSLCYNFSLYGIRSWLSARWQLGEVRWILFSSISTFLFSPLMFLLLERLDSRTMKKTSSLGVTLP